MKSWQAIVRRLAGMVVSLFGLSVIIFFISRILPGNPARLALGPTATEQQVQELAREMGLTEPLPIQYLDYMRGLVSGDLGMALETRNPVLEDILRNLPATLELVTVAMALTVFLGIPLGIVSARNKDGVVDNGTRLFAFLTVSVPSFFIGIVLQLVFGTMLEWLPQVGRISARYGNELPRTTGFLLIDTIIAGNLGAHVDVWLHLVLPALALAFAPMGQVIRITRSSMIDEQGKDYVEAAWGYGMPPWMVVYKYTLKNAFIPTLTILGLLYAFLLGGAFLIELVFAWGGLASYGVNALLNNDINAVVGVTMTIGLAFVVVNFVVDLVLSQIDPRIELAKET